MCWVRIDVKEEWKDAAVLARSLAGRAFAFAAFSRPDPLGARSPLFFLFDGKNGRASNGLKIVLFYGAESPRRENDGPGSCHLQERLSLFASASLFSYPNIKWSKHAEREKLRLSETKNESRSFPLLL